jgi:phage-related protein (TIGR01555 family)
MAGFGFQTGTAAPVPAVRNDGWINVLTGMGIAGRDKRLGGSFGQATVLDRVTLEELYRGDSMAAKVVDLPAEEMTREWIEIKVSDDPEQAEEIDEALKNLHAQERFQEAEKWARLYGGSVIILGVDDGQEFNQPLNLKQVRSLKFLNVLDRWQITRAQVYEDPTQPKYGQTKTYRLNPLHGGQDNGKEIHESRVLRFDGVMLPDRLMIQNNGWGDSVLNRLFDAIQGYANAHGTIPTILQDFVQAVYRIKGLATMLAQGDDKAVVNRLQLVELTRSMFRAIVLDEGEEWSRQTTTVAGLPDLVDRTERRLVAETSIPHTKLLGESPGSSLGEGGVSETKDWYDSVSAMQEARHREPLTYLIRVLLAARRSLTQGTEPDQWSFTFRSLWQMDAKEDAEIRNIQSKTDETYIRSGVLMADEVAVSRFGGDGWSAETTLDMETRAAAEAADPAEDLDADPPAEDDGKDPPTEA